MLTENIDKDKYNITEYGAASKKYGLMLLAVLLPYYIICVVIYLLQRSYANIFATIFKSTFLLELFVLMFCMFIVIGLALLLKAVVLTAFSEGKSKSLKFKIISEVQKPHVYLSEPIKIWRYRICLAVYIIVAAILPYIIAFIIGDFMFVLASFITAYWAGSDIWLLISLFGKPGGDYITDFDSVLFYRIYKEK